jgi:hypothetical protein
VTTGDPVVSKVYTVAATYQVTLFVTDRAGRSSTTVTVAVPVIP